MNLELKNKNILITGGSKGIGKAAALTFLKEEANVTVIGRDQETLENFKNEHPKIRYIQADLLNKDDRRKIKQEFLENNKTIDVLINNVGGSNGGLFEETELDLFYKAFELNFFTAVDLCKKFYPIMKSQKHGSIINISSIFGRESGGLITYNSSKSALISFTKALALEGIKYNIRVNSIAPGSIHHETSIWERKMQEDYTGIQQFIKENLPAGRFGKAEEVANLLAFVASEKSSWLVGTCINIDGGQSKMNL